MTGVAYDMTLTPRHSMDTYGNNGTLKYGRTRFSKFTVHTVRTVHTVLYNVL